MVARTVLRQSILRAVLPAACIAASSYFAFHAVSGPTGLFAWQDYQAENSALTREALAVKQARDALRRQVASLDPDHVSPDLADELVRKNLNVLRDDEVIVSLDSIAGDDS